MGRSHASFVFLPIAFLALCAASFGSACNSSTKQQGPSGSESGERKEIPARRPGSSQDGAVETGSAEGGAAGDGGELNSNSTADSSGSGSAPRRRQFRKGDTALNGLIADDVPAYNAAQGDPIVGTFGLAEAFEGDPALANRDGGKLTATLHTTMGDIECVLFEDEAPATVANFVGLARGTRPYLDRKSKNWQKGPFYDNVLFHRVIKGFMIQTGDPSGSGVGGPGYFLIDEFTKKGHDKAGALSMANRNPVDPATEKLFVDKETGQPIGNTGSSQFFITVAATPQLNGRHSVFGQCDTKVALAIANVSVENRPELRIDHRPLDPVRIKNITFQRKAKK
jgi:cyclophilin family peptidyl-prolyl cis-trans isomerase